VCCKVLQPFAQGLDILQGEEKCFYGTLLPILQIDVKNIRDMKPNLSITTTGLAYSIEYITLRASLIQKKQF